MPSIEIIKKYVSKPSSREWNEKRIYISNSGTMAVLKNPFESHMGAYTWDLELSDRELHASKSGLLCPNPYDPWCNDSACLFLNSLKDGALIYEIKLGLTRKCELRDVVGCIGSRRFSLYLVTTLQGEYLVGRDGRIVRSLMLRRPAHGFPFLSWFDAAGLFFAVEAEGRGIANLRFFEALTAEPLGTESINPNSLFPYADANYQDLNRNTYALVLSTSRQCVGSLLDEWSSVEFDVNTNILKMMVYRPVGKVFEKRSMQVCAVEEQWVEVRLNP